MTHDAKQQQVRESIAEAALDLFCRKGFDATTAEEIAREAGVSRRSFFRYFSSKDEVIGKASRDYGEALVAAILATPRTYSAMEVMRDVVLRVSAQVADSPRTRDFIRVTLESPAARQALLARHGDVEGKVAEAYTDRLPTDGSVAPGAARLMAGVTFSVLDAAFLTWYEQEGADISQIAENILGTLTQLIIRPVHPATPERWFAGGPTHSIPAN